MSGNTYHITASDNAFVNVGNSFSGDGKPVDQLDFLLPGWQSNSTLGLHWDHDEARRKKVDKTGAWFLETEDFQSWLLLPNTFMWLHGTAGCGKTVLRYERPKVKRRFNGAELTREAQLLLST